MACRPSIRARGVFPPWQDRRELPGAFHWPSDIEPKWSEGRIPDQAPADRGTHGRVLAEDVADAVSAVGIQFILLRRVDIIRMEVMRFCLECWRSSVIGGNRIATKRGEGIIYRGRREFGFAG